MDEVSIHTPRLVLWSMSEAFLAASAERQPERAREELPYPVDMLDDAWWEAGDLIAMRLADLRRDPSARPWLLRAMLAPAEQAMVGYVGFHTPPGPAYLADVCPGGVEIGYTVFERFRRRGFAREAVEGLLAWARASQGQRAFVASVSPQNRASLGLIRSLGFVHVGGHEDEIDGWEDIYRLERE